MKSIYKICLVLAVIFITACDEDKMDPYVAWENPADMYEGDVLGSVQLNAMAETDGEFSYFPPEGTVLELGDNQKLSLIFTPFDNENYNVIEDSVFVNVKNVPIVDADGNLYTEIEIGNQVWLAEPLITTHFNNGDPIANIVDDTQWGSQAGPAFGWFENNAGNALPWGGYYNQAVVNDSRGICPNGYHIPSQEEYQTLIDYLGEGAGSKLKSIMNWSNPGNNSSGFNAPGSSLRMPDGVYRYQNLVSFFWTTTSSPDQPGGSMIFVLSNEGNAGFQSDGQTYYGLPIRCIKD